MQIKNWKSKQHDPKSKITNERDERRHEQNNSKTFQLNNIYYKNTNAKS